MKKLIATFAAIASLAMGSAVANIDLGGWFCDISTNGKVGFETEDIWLGKKVGETVFDVALQLSMPVCDGDLYFGITGYFPADPLTSTQYPTAIHNTHASDAGNRLVLNLGYMMPLACLPSPECFCMDDTQLSLDFGYNYYWWLQDRNLNPWSPVNRSNEIYVGLLTDAFLRPALYAFYDFNLEQFRLLGSIGYTYDLSCWCGLDGFAIDLNAYIAWLTADKYNGDQRQGSLPKQKNGYTYGGISADIVYSLNDCADIRVGIRWAANNDGSSKDQTTYAYENQGGTQSRVWWGAGIDFGF